MRVLFWFVSAIAVAPAFGAEMCFRDTYYYCCRYFNCCVCDYVAPVRWVGFRSDSAACEDWPQFSEIAVSLSASSTDPHVNTGPLPSDGRLYLWNLSLDYAGAGYGWAFLSLGVDGDLPIQGYEPIAPAATNLWRESDRSLTFDACTMQHVESDPPPTIIGAFVIGTSAVEGLTWGRMKALYR